MDDSAWPIVTPPALYGLPGAVVRILAPHTEADPAAILLQFLAAFGNLVGPGPHGSVGSTRHGLNLFVVLLGESGHARKATSWRQIAGPYLPGSGSSRGKEIRALFHGHISSERIDVAQEKLVSQGLASSQTSPGRGRPATRWTGDFAPAEGT
jgi:hypothetical protein